MITVKKESPGIYRVTETIHSFHGTRTRHIWYDLNKSLKSEKEDFPASAFTRDISPADREWFDKYYLPKAVA